VNLSGALPRHLKSEVLSNAKSFWSCRKCLIIISTEGLSQWHICCIIYVLRGPAVYLQLEVFSMFLINQILLLSLYCSSACFQSEGVHTPQDAIPAKSAAVNPTLAQLELCLQRFRAAGFTAADANRFAHIAIGLADPLAKTALPGCGYYFVTAHFCDKVTRRSETYYIGALCIEEKLHLCVAPTCSKGQSVYYKLVTSSTCKPASTCVFLEVYGPLSTSEPSICNALQDCSCWPTLACDTAVCVTNIPGLGTPRECPKCE